MNSTAIKGVEARNQQNENILAALVMVKTCASALIRDGFTVLEVTFEGCKPVVWIQNCPACEKLNGAWYRYEHDATGHYYTMQVNLHGCRVQWRTTRH